MTIPEIAAELNQINAEVQGSIQHAILRVSKCKQSLAEHNNPVFQPAIDMMEGLEKKYKTLLM